MVEIVCTLCRKRFDTLQELKEHLKKEHNTKLKAWLVAFSPAHALAEYLERHGIKAVPEDDTTLRYKDLEVSVTTAKKEFMYVDLNLEFWPKDFRTIGELIDAIENSMDPTGVEFGFTGVQEVKTVIECGGWDEDVEYLKVVFRVRFPLYDLLGGGE